MINTLIYHVTIDPMFHMHKDMIIVTQQTKFHRTSEAAGHVVYCLEEMLKSCDLFMRNAMYNSIGISHSPK